MTIHAAAFYLYLATCLVTGDRYVGRTTQTIARRWSRHKADARSTSQTHLHRAMRKYGVENFIIEPLILFDEDFSSEPELNAAEIRMIRLLRINCTLYNLTDGGEGTTGSKLGGSISGKINASKPDYFANLGRTYGHIGGHIAGNLTKARGLGIHAQGVASRAGKLGGVTSGQIQASRQGIKITRT